MQTACVWLTRRRLTYYSHVCVIKELASYYTTELGQLHCDVPRADTN